MRSRNFMAPAVATAGVFGSFGVTTTHAAFAPPTLWSIGDAGSTYQQWDRFTSTTGPNAPDVGVFNPNSPDHGNSLDYGNSPDHGTPNAFDAAAPGSGAFVTSGGNIYSPFGVIVPTADVPGYGAATGHDFTTVVVNLRTLGTQPDVDAATVSDGTTTYAADEYAFLGSDGSGFTFGTEHWWQFNLPGSASDYRFVVPAAGSSMSLDRLRIDTFTSATPVIEPNPIPEPSTAMAIVAVAGLLTTRRRR